MIPSLTIRNFRRQQTPFFTVIFHHDEMIPVMTIGVIAQLHEIIPHLVCGLPKALLMLPALPARQPCRAENNDKRNCHQGFDERKAEFCFHASSVARQARKNEWINRKLRGAFREIFSVA